MDNKFDVAVVGYGPTGMAAAALLGQQGHKVVVIERWPSLYGLPRLTHIDDETARTLQSICDIDAALADSTPTEYEYVNGKGDLLLQIPTFMGNMGYPAHNSIYQPDIEDALDARLRSLPNVEIRQGWALTDINQDSEGVTLEISPWENRTADTSRATTLQTSYVIGADGNRSIVREYVGTERTDYGFEETWINMDMEWLRPRDEQFHIAKQFCDPARGHMFMGIGKGRQRFEFALHPDENPADFLTAEAGYAWLRETHGLGREDLTIIRQLAYTFVGRIADAWRKDRVFLAGDAAHVMPPYLGQGACSGIRDSANLAWKLHLVLTRQAGDSLLDTYQEERWPHAAAAVQGSIGLGRIANTTDPDAAAQRDAAFAAENVPSPPGLPQLSGRILPDAGPASPVGAPAPQGKLRQNGLVSLGDDILGYGFHLILAPGVSESLEGAAQDVITALDIRVLDFGRDIEDEDGVYAAFLKSHDSDAALVRPDHIVHGVATVATVSTLLQDLYSRLQQTVVV